MALSQIYACWPLKRAAERLTSAAGKGREAFSDFAYDTASAVLAAIERAATPDRKAILNAMTTLGDVQGVGGRFTFDINGDITITTVSGNMVCNGMFEYLEKLAP